MSMLMLFGSFEELARSRIELDNSVLRSDHALAADTERMPAQVRAAISRPEQARLRPEWMRGL